MSQPEGERRQTRPETLRLRNLSASLTADDLQRSLAFYTDALGFTVEERWEEEGELKGVMLVAGGCHLGLSQDDFARGTGRTKGTGFRLWAETAQDLDALARRLAEHGVEADGPREEPWGGRTLTVVDPDGFKLTLSPPEEK